MVRATFALALVAARAAAQTGTIRDMEHIIIFMQENRAADHYFGTLNGFRGFTDRAVHPLPSGLPAYYQPASLTNASSFILPFHVSTLNTSATCMPAPTMDYVHDIAIWNASRMDGWNTAREPGMGMSFFTREDLPYYYELYSNFAVGDAYHQSTCTCTDPNRLHLFSGSNGLSVGQAPVLDNTEPPAGWGWPTMGEILEDAGLDWRVLQEEDNFDDNGFAWFHSFIDSKPGDALYDKGRAPVPSGSSPGQGLVDALEQMLATDTLPQVMWIVGPANLSEHATYHPAAGEDLTARLLARLQAHPDVYAKTAFVLNYDEGGQFATQGWIPVAPLNAPHDGASTLSVKEEDFLGLPIGPCFRVPLLIVSPWTRGNIVVSQAFDHTSVIRLIEARFNVSCPNISPWRRGVLGDMTSAFDFARPDYSWPQLPNTSAYPSESIVQCSTLPDPVLPTEQWFPSVEPGTKISRALPYVFLVSDAVDASSSTLQLTIDNAGPAGAAFHLFDIARLAEQAPRRYGLAANTSLVDPVPIPAPSSSSSQVYYVALHGMNGFVRTFSGDVLASGGAGLLLSASLLYDPGAKAVVVSLSNANSASVVFTVTDNAYGAGGPWTFTVAGGAANQTHSFDVSASGQWYDLTAEVDSMPSVAGEVSSASASASSSASSSAPILFSRRFMGRMETGSDSVSDPAMAAGVPGYVPTPHAAGGERAYAAAVLRHERLGGSVRARVAFESEADGGSIIHPPRPDEHRFLKMAEGPHKDAMWHWDPSMAPEL